MEALAQHAASARAKACERTYGGRERKRSLAAKQVPASAVKLRPQKSASVTSPHGAENFLPVAEGLVAPPIPTGP